MAACCDNNPTKIFLEIMIITMTIQGGVLNI